MQIITGYTGKPHVTAEHDRDINIGLFGAESYVLPTGMMMEAEISSNNEIKIRDGVLMHQGCAGSIKKNTYDSVTITNGSQGMKRVDLIVVRYEKNEDTETEELKWVVLQGIPSEDAPETPDYTQGDIQAGDYVADMPMYEVTIDGLNITQIKKVFKTTESLTELNGKLEKRDGGYTQNIAIFISQYKEGGVVPFATNANTVGLPAQTTEWQYATGFFIKRQDEAFVVLLSRNNKIATNFFNGTTLSVWSIR